MILKKSSHCYNEILSSVKKIEKELLCRCLTDFNRSFDNIYFTGSGYDLVYDLKSQQTFIVGEMDEKSRAIYFDKILSYIGDINLYTEWLKLGDKSRKEVKGYDEAFKI